MKRILGEYYEQLYAHKLENLDEMDQFVLNNKLSKLTQDELDNLSSPITLWKMSSWLKNV